MSAVFFLRREILSGAPLPSTGRKSMKNKKQAESVLMNLQVSFKLLCGLLYEL